jgi:malonate decarboxylase epsilon subunit
MCGHWILRRPFAPIYPASWHCLRAGVASARALEDEGVIPEAVAGLSVGAFAAAVHAHVLTLADCVRLVRQGAELMEKNSPEGYGLSAIIGLKEEQVVTLIGEANTTDNPVYLGNVNSLKQIVISGLAKESIPQVRSIPLAKTSLSYVVKEAFQHSF